MKRSTLFAFSAAGLFMLAAVAANQLQTTPDWALGAAPAAKKAVPASGKCNPRAGSGTLEVRFAEDLPADAAGISVSVTGPNRFSRTGLTPGRNYIYQRVRTGKYTVSITGAASRRFETHEIVDTAFALGADPNPACLQKNATARITIGYVPEPGSGKMWVGTTTGYPYTLFSIERNNLLESGTPNPGATIAELWNGAYNNAFDKQGNLWIVIAGGRIERYARDQLGRSRAQPDIVLTGRDIEYGDALAFDADGNLWYSNRDKGKVMRFTPNQIAQSGQPVPAIVLDGFTQPHGIAFDQAGNLWVLDDIATHQHIIHRYGASRLGRSTNEPGDIQLSVGKLVGEPGRQTFTQFGGPAVLAFDRDNNLWVAFWNENKIAKITPSEQERGGEIISGVNLRCCSSMIMSTMMFDNEGGLWVAGSPTGNIVRFSPDQLNTGAEEPARIIDPADEPGLYPNGIFLNPSPSWSPLNDR